jgi:Asp-tRNA(Asn)/Glu-tRNA(Gln) amidotransferase A subunit family amidase
MKNNELENLTIAEVGRELRSGHLSPVELTQSYLERIKRYDASLHELLSNSVYGRSGGSPV